MKRPRLRAKGFCAGRRWYAGTSDAPGLYWMPSFPKRGEGSELGLQRLAGCSWYLNLSRSLSQVYIQTRTSYVGHGLNPLSQIHGPRLHHHVSMVAYESRSEGQGQLRWRRFYFLLLFSFIRLERFGAHKRSSNLGHRRGEYGNRRVKKINTSPMSSTHLDHHPKTKP